MKNNIDFYYVVWGNTRWKILLISIMMLRKIYKDDNVKVICYNDPPNFFLRKKEKLKIQIIKKSNMLLEKRFNFKGSFENLYNSHKNCIYKAINFFEISSNTNSKAILLDCDVFLLSKFSGFDWSKICVYCPEETNIVPKVNVGVVGYHTSSSAFDFAKKIFFKNIENIMKEDFDQTKYIKKALSEEWLNWRLSSINLNKKEIKKNILLIQEEIIFNYIFKYQNKNNFFYNIGIENNGMILSTKDLYKEKKINNFHLMGIFPNELECLLSELSCTKIISKNIIIKNCKNNIDIKILEKILKNKFK